MVTELEKDAVIELYELVLMYSEFRTRDKEFFKELEMLSVITDTLNELISKTNDNKLKAILIDIKHNYFHKIYKIETKRLDDLINLDRSVFDTLLTHCLD